jgi:hypothetical protein
MDKTTTSVAQTDYLAIILIGGGSSWGRSPDKEEAIKLALRNYRDWGGHFDIWGKEVTLNVIDVKGYDHVHWGSYPDGWLHGVSEATGEDEVINRTNEQITRVFTAKRKVKA